MTNGRIVAMGWLCVNNPPEIHIIIAYNVVIGKSHTTLRYPICNLFDTHYKPDQCHYGSICL